MNLNVLVVDDETPICDWLVYCIQKASPDYRVVAAFNGEDALAKVLEFKPDLVLTDIRMPGMDGLELMRQTLEVLPLTTFAILTNYAEFGYAKQAISLGAREYFLKSELRATDIEKLMKAVLNAKTVKRSEKVDDVFQSGCIDLYNFYRNQEVPGFADQFWEHHGMQKHVPYQLLCIPGGSRPEEWRELAVTAERFQAVSGNEAYLAAACEKGCDYIVVQTKWDLGSCVSRVAAALSHRGFIGISSVIPDRADFARGLQESTCAQMTGFFAMDASPVCFSDIRKRPGLDRNSLLHKRDSIIRLIQKRNYLEAEEQARLWFSQMSVPGSADVRWSVDTCRRMVLSIEEQYYQETKCPPSEMTVPKTAAECLDRCLELFAHMEQSYSGRYSPSIAAAIEYVHSHYQEQIAMTDVARQVYRSPEYFSRQFKEETGENFNTYLTQYRLDRAQEMLDRTDLRISEIAERVGYTTPGYFSRLYKKYKGITPEHARMSKF